MARLTANGIQFNLLDANDSITSFYWIYPAGTKKLFYQSTAPTGWTQDASQGNKALRVVNGTGGGSGNTSNWTTVLQASNTISVGITGTFPITASLGGHTLSLTQLANHTHTLPQMDLLLLVVQAVVKHTHTHSQDLQQLTRLQI